MKTVSIKIITLISLFCFTTLIAQTFTATVDNSTVNVNEEFQVSFTFEGEDISSLTEFTPPSFSNFIVLSGPNQSTSMQIINGAVSASKTFSYYLRPSKVGKFTIGKAKIKYNNRSFESNELTVQVVKDANNNSSASQNEEIAKNLFIKAEASKINSYIGEQIKVSYKLYTRLNIAAQMSISKLPQYQGFWAEEVESPSQLFFRTEMYNGKQFRVALLKSVVLFPSQAGKLKVTPFELTVPIQIQRKRKRTGNIFDDFFNDPFDAGQTIQYQAISNVITINVKPLPEQSKPESFSGAVGDYNFNADLDRSVTKTNEPVSLKLTISGSGNIKLVSFPEINLPNGVEKYEPKITDNISRKNFISGSKTAEYLIVPRTPGQKIIPAIEFSFFNPNLKQYKTVKAGPFKLDVKVGDRTASSDINGISKEDIKLLGDDIRFIKLNSDDISLKKEILILQSKFWLAVFLPLILMFTSIVWKKKNDKLKGNVKLFKYQKAEKIARNRLKKAKKLLKENKAQEFYAELSLALFGYLEDKLHIPKSEFTIEKAISFLRNFNMKEELLTELNEVASKCEFARFAPGGLNSQEMNDFFIKTSNLIIEIERTLSK